MVTLLRCSIFCSAIAISSICAAQPPSDPAESKVITTVLKSQFERPGAALQVAPISIANDRAVVGWVQGANGGRALLQKIDGHWEVQICAGDGLRNASELVLTGMDKAQAQELAAKVNQAEARLSKAYLAKLSKFQGSVNMSSTTGHSGSR